MKVDKRTWLEFFWFLSMPENTTEVECYDDYRIANDYMRSLKYEE